MRYFILVLVMSLGALVPAFGDDAPPQLRVLTYNIHRGLGVDGKLDLERIADVIAELEPDVVALQEVDNGTLRSHGVDQAARLGELTGMEAVYGKAIDYQGGAYGQAILSRHPIVETQVHRLPQVSQREPRIAVASRIALPDGPEFLFVGTHLDYVRDPSDRLVQTRRLNELFRDAALPVVLAGDLNDTPGSQPMRILTEVWTDPGAGQALPTFPAADPTRQIDYVLVRPADRWEVSEIRVIDEPVASDHRPLLLVLELVPGEER